MKKTKSILKTSSFLALIFTLSCGKTEEPVKPVPPAPEPVKTNKVVKVEKKKPTFNPKLMSDGLDRIDSFKKNLTEENIAEVMDEAIRKYPGWRLFRSFYQECAKLSPTNALNWATSNLQRGGDRTYCLRYGINKWAEIDPIKALEWAYALSDDKGRECAMRTAFNAWAVTDPENAAAQLLAMEDFITRPMSVSQVAYQLAMRDPQRTVNWAMELEDKTERILALKSVGRATYLFGREPAEAWDRETSRKEIRDGLLNQMATWLGGEDLQAATDWFYDELRDFKDAESSTRIDWDDFIEKKTSEAIWWASQIPEYAFRESALFMIGQDIARKDPENASITAGQMTMDHLLGNVFYKVGYYLTQKDPEAAKTWMKTVEDKKSPVAQEAAQAGANAAIDQTEVKHDYFSSYYDDLSLKLYLSECLPNGPFREHAIHVAARHIAKFKPAVATQFIMEQLPDGKPLDDALRTTLREWTKRDHEGVVAWIKAQRSQFRKNHAIALVVPELVENEPETAVALTALMSVGELRQETLKDAVYEWGKDDLEEAQVWAETVGDAATKATAAESLEKVVKRAEEKRLKKEEEARKKAEKEALQEPDSQPATPPEATPAVTPLPE